MQADLTRPRLVLLVLVLPTARALCTPCNKYGTKRYWDAMYAGKGELPAERYSWYCGWRELQPFWAELVPDRAARTLVPGVGNDESVASLYDAGWTNLRAFDYSSDAVERARSLYADRRIELDCADARDLPYEDATFDAVLDKGALDAVGIASLDALAAATGELARTVREGGVVVSISRALEPSELVGAFPDALWANLRDGRLHVCESGEVTLDLAAGLFAWRRRGGAGSTREGGVGPEEGAAT